MAADTRGENAEIGQQIILQSLFPGFRTDSQGELEDYIADRGTPVASSLAGGGTVAGGTRDIYGSTANWTGSGTAGQSTDVPQGQTLLPSLSGIPTDATTLFEAYQAGDTTDFENQILGSIGNIASGGAATQANANLTAGTSGGQYGGFDPGDISVDDIGTITSEIIDNLPPEFQTFIDRVMSDTTPENINAELDNLASAIQAEAEQSMDTLGGKLLSRFSAMGMGSSGSAIEAVKELGIELGINVNRTIAETRYNAVLALERRKDQAIQLMANLIDAGDSQRAQDVQAEIAEMNARLQAHTAALAEQGAFDRALLASRVSLRSQEMGLLSDTLGALVGSRQFDEGVRIKGQREQTLLPYDFIGNVIQGGAGTTQRKPKGGGFDIGGALGGLFGAAGQIGGSAIESGLIGGATGGPGGAVAGAASGALSSLLA